MTTTNNNPLGRLHNILSEIADSNNLSPYTTLSAIFNLNPDDKGAILASYSELYKLCEDARLLINNLTNINHNKLLEPINSAVLALSRINFNNSIDGLRNLNDCLDEKLLSNLDLCSEMLSFSYKEKYLEDSTLKELSDNLNLIINSITDSNINDELKLILIQHLNTIDLSIKKYKIYGVSGIKSSLTSTIGDIVINKDLVTTEDEKSVIENILGLMSKINTVISFSKNITPLIPSIIGLLN
jgi:hypothetical protein